VSEFGSQLRQQRRKAKLSQDALAEASGISRTSVVNIESGRQGVSLVTLYRLADALACEPSALLPSRPSVDVPKILYGADSDESREAAMRVARRMEGGEG
jgi:transcriptional regulator with XRE-family HTH domain